MDSYLQYLVNKFFIFEDGVELHPSNAMLQLTLKQDSDQNCKMDELCANMTKRVLNEYACFEISTNVQIEDRILNGGNRAEEIYLNYKKYKCSNVRETETYLHLDETLDTSKTSYVESVDIKTHELLDTFGKYKTTGRIGDNYRYEYKFKFITGGKMYIFSLYDYLNDNDEFDRESEIYWHVASNTNNRDIINKFTKMLMENGSGQATADDECC